MSWSPFSVDHISTAGHAADHHEEFVSPGRLPWRKPVSICRCCLLEIAPGLGMGDMFTPLLSALGPFVIVFTRRHREGKDEVERVLITLRPPGA